MHFIDELSSSLDQKLPTFNITAITRFKSCPIQSILSLREFQNFIKPKPHKAMVKGTLGHDILENHLKAPHDFEKLWNLAIENLKSKRSDLEFSIFEANKADFKLELKKRYTRWCTWDRANKAPKYREVELCYKNIRGQIDRIDFDDTLIDFKFSKKTLVKNMADYALQLGGYYYLCEKNDIEINQAMIVIPKIIKIDVGIVTKDELEENKAKFKKIYKEMIDYYAEFMQKNIEIQFCEQCFYCSVKEACQKIK